MTETEFNNILKEDITYINNSIDFFISAVDAPLDIKNAMKYSLENGGKRIRPVLCIEFSKTFGCDVKKSIFYAAALEFIHTYSLIHDDLPCMDDDNMRRGKASCHIQYGEALALLAGDGLLTESFELISESPLDGSLNNKAAEILAHECGIAGMVGGQVLDLKYSKTNPTASEILKMYEMKTARLIICACKLGCLVGGADKILLEKAEEYGYGLGLAFQIQDDILDIMGDKEKLGKPIGSDKKNNKNTYISLVGIKEAKEKALHYTNEALDALTNFKNTDFIEHLTLKLLSRDN